jgi:hypothetical protein
MYTDYWTCYKVAFLTRERIICDVLDGMLEQGNYRYPPYVATVLADPRAVYVFTADSPQAAAFPRQAGAPVSRFIQLRLDDYVVFLPPDGDVSATAHTVSRATPASEACQDVHGCRWRPSL